MQRTFFPSIVSLAFYTHTFIGFSFKFHSLTSHGVLLDFFLRQMNIYSVSYLVDRYRCVQRNVCSVLSV